MKKKLAYQKGEFIPLSVFKRIAACRMAYTKKKTNLMRSCEKEMLAVEKEFFLKDRKLQREIDNLRRCCHHRYVPRNKLDIIDDFGSETWEVCEVCGKVNLINVNEHNPIDQAGEPRSVCRTLGEQGLPEVGGSFADEYFQFRENVSYKD